MSNRNIELTEEEYRLIEENRQKALAKRNNNQTNSTAKTTSPFFSAQQSALKKNELTPEQLEIIEKNKKRALEKLSKSKNSNAKSSGQKSILSFFKPQSTPTKSAPQTASSPPSNTSDQLNDTKSNQDADSNPSTTSTLKLSPVKRPIEIENDDMKMDIDSEEDIPLSTVRRRSKRHVDYNENISDSDENVEVKAKSISKKYKDDDADFEIDGDTLAYIDSIDLNCDMMEIDEPEPMSTPTKTFTNKPQNSSSWLDGFKSGDRLGSSSKPTRIPTTPTQAKKSTPLPSAQKLDNNGKHEERYPWLADVSDASRRRPTDPDYDPRTLFIPQYAWSKFTPFEKQFWEIKSKNFNTVIFFKKGKFYELYENDADIGHQKFDLKLTDRVNMKMVGVPETSLDFWASKFIAAGYKIGKVEQMETAVGKSLREKDSSSKKDNVIRRELTTILSASTLVDPGLLTSDMAVYCMALTEQIYPNGSGGKFGIAFVDAAAAEFHLASLEDDGNFTKFETLILQVQPTEIVYPKGYLSSNTLKALKNSCPNLTLNPITPNNEFWNADKTITEFEIMDYFGKNKDQWPSAFLHYMSDELVMSAIGGLTWYLRSLKLDTDLLTAKNMKLFDPVKSFGTLVLDGPTLSNLEVLANNIDGSNEGTIHQLLNHCQSSFGKRKFRNWLCHPLKDIDDINERLDAIEDIERLYELQNIGTRLSIFPDLERLITRIHCKSIRVKNFLSVLKGFDDAMSLFEDLKSLQSKFSSKLLIKLCQDCPDLAQRLYYFDHAFDHDLAAKEGVVIPVPGSDEAYDQANQTVVDIETELDNYLVKMKAQLKCKSIEYKHINKEIYQMELPASFQVPGNFIKISQTQKVKRYYTSKIEELVKNYNEAKEIKTKALATVLNRLCETFDQDYPKWLKMVSYLATLDCLFSLAKSKSLMGEPCVRPQFINDTKSVLEVKDLRHPCVVSQGKIDYIPNNTYLGGNEPDMILLTGPNMGGKSTLLRQTCVAVIMAQLGCYVPASSCKLTVFDRIFTRIGANDNILAGQSTFMVELSETAKILREATNKSLVILDELGRGTSTFDGYAIAFSVLHYLTTQVNCLGLFSTHYGMLTEEMKYNENISIKHMKCLVNPNQREVTFLYKLTPGACPKSYGMNVAHMAGIPEKIIENAELAAQNFEKDHRIITENQIVSNNQLDSLTLTEKSSFANLIRSFLN